MLITFVQPVAECQNRRASQISHHYEIFIIRTICAFRASNMVIAKEFFREIGFTINWDSGDYVGFQRDDCRFILQKYDVPEFAANFMLSIKVSSILEFQSLLVEKAIRATFWREDRHY